MISAGKNKYFPNTSPPHRAITPVQTLCLLVAQLKYKTDPRVRGLIALTLAETGNTNGYTPKNFNISVT
jgi:hypothetical protein